MAMWPSLPHPKAEGSGATARRSNRQAIRRQAILGFMVFNVVLDPATYHISAPFGRCDFTSNRSSRREYVTTGPSS